MASVYDVAAFILAELGQMGSAPNRFFHKP